MMERLLEYIIVPHALIVSLLISLFVSSLLSLLIALVYRLTHRSMSYEPTFLTTMVMVAPIVTLVMFFIRGDLVLSLGLVGSLSIIRFRTPIKDTRDMIFLFWAIAAGLGSGTDNLMLAVIATVFMAIITATLYLVEYGNPTYSDYLMVLSGHNPYYPSEAKEIILRHTIGSRIRSHEVREDLWEIVYELRFNQRQAAETNRLVEDIRSMQGVEKVSLLAPQMALPL